MNNNTNQIFIQGCEKAVKRNERTKICVRIDNSLGFVDEINVLFNKYGQMPGKECNYQLEYDKSASTEKWSFFEKEISFSQEGYRSYFFEIVLNGKKTFIKYDRKTRKPILTDKDYPFFETFVYNEHFTTPDWAKGGIMYQIYVDTFNAKNIPESVKDKVSKWGEEPKWKPDPDGEYRNDKYFGGNLEGIIEKIPHMQSLGITIPYITPIFKSNTSHRYSILDYRLVDEMVGNWEIVQRMVDEFHNVGMHPILDVVFNHCHPDNHLCKEHSDMFTEGFWWGFRDMKEFNMYSEKYRKFLKDTLKFYLIFFDGIRIDVADQIPDHILALMREVAKEVEKETGKCIWILAEIWKNSVKGDFRTVLHGKEIDSPMNYQFSDAWYRYIRWGDYEYFQNTIFDDVLGLYPKPAIDVLMNPLSTHDIPRIPNILTSPIMLKEKYVRRHNNSVEKVFLWDYDKKDEYWYENGVYSTWKRRSWEFAHTELTDEEKEYCDKRERLLVFMQFTFPGIPSIYAGDEFGLLGLKDPGNRRCIPWDKPDEKRFKVYVQMAKFRKVYNDVFKAGECDLLYIDDGLVVYNRFIDGKKITMAVNITSKAKKIPVELEGEVISSFEGSSKNIVNPFDAVAIYSVA